MNIYDKKQIKCSICDKSIGEINIDSSLIFPLCVTCNKKEKHTLRKGVNRILVPVDATKKSIKALDTAIYLAKHLGSSITLMQAIPYVKIGNSLLMKNIFNELRRDAEKSIQIVKMYCENKNITAKHLVVRGEDAESIIKTAKKYRHDLIVMGSSGKGLLKDLVFGSVSNYVMHNSNIPVLIVKETSAKLGTKIDKNIPKLKSNQKPRRQGGGVSFSSMKAKAEL